MTALSQNSKNAIRSGLANNGAASEVIAKLDAIEAVSAAELGVIDGVTPGTQAASKADTRTAAGLQTYGEGFNDKYGTTTGTKHGTGPTEKQSFWGVTPVVQPSGANQTAVTDNTGGSVADAIAAVVTAPTAIAETLTDSTGGSGTHDDTLADGLTATALTDNSGGEAADGTIAVLVDAGGTAAGAPTTASVANAITELSTAINLCVTDLGVQNQNDSDLAQKIIELVTAQAEDRAAIVALTDGLAKALELTNALRAALVLSGQIKGAA